MSEYKYNYEVLKGHIYLHDMPRVSVCVPYAEIDDLWDKPDGKESHRDNSRHICEELQKTKQIDITQILIEKLQNGEIKAYCDIDNDDLYEYKEEIVNNEQTYKRIKPDNSPLMEDVNGDIIVSIY